MHLNSPTSKPAELSLSPGQHTVELRDEGKGASLRESFVLHASEVLTLTWIPPSIAGAVNAIALAGADVPTELRIWPQRGGAEPPLELLRARLHVDGASQLHEAMSRAKDRPR